MRDKLVAAMIGVVLGITTGVTIGARLYHRSVVESNAPYEVTPNGKIVQFPHIPNVMRLVGITHGGINAKEYGGSVAACAIFSMGAAK